MKRIYGQGSQPLAGKFGAGSRMLTHVEAMDLLLSGAELGVTVRLTNGGIFLARIPPYQGQLPLEGINFVLRIPQEVTGHWQLCLQVAMVNTPELVAMPDPAARLELEQIESIFVDTITVAGVILTHTHPALHMLEPLKVDMPTLWQLVQVVPRLELTDGRLVEYSEADTQDASLKRKLVIIEGGAYDLQAAITVGRERTLPLGGIEVFTERGGVMYYADKLVADIEAVSA